MSRNSDNISSTLSIQMAKHTYLTKWNWNILNYFAKKLDIICWHFEVWTVHKYVNLVDLVTSFPTSIHCKRRRRYSRERGSQSLEVIQFIFSFASLTRMGARILLPGGTLEWFSKINYILTFVPLLLICGISVLFQNCENMVIVASIFEEPWSCSTFWLQLPFWTFAHSWQA